MFQSGQRLQVPLTSSGSSPLQSDAHFELQQIVFTTASFKVILAWRLATRKLARRLPCASNALYKLLEQAWAHYVPGATCVLHHSLRTTVVARSKKKKQKTRFFFIVVFHKRKQLWKTASRYTATPGTSLLLALLPVTVTVYNLLPPAGRWSTWTYCYTQKTDERRDNYSML